MFEIFNEMLNDFNNLCDSANELIKKGENDENKTKD